MDNIEGSELGSVVGSELCKPGSYGQRQIIPYGTSLFGQSNAIFSSLC